MKKKIFTLLVMVMVAMTASADKGFVLTKGANPHGTTTIKVGDAEADIAAEGTEVTVVVTPAKDYYVATVVGRLYTTWGGAKTRGTSIKIGDKLLATKVKDKDNTYSFKMPAANVEVSVSYVETIDVETKETETTEGEGEGKEVSNVTVDIKPAADADAYVDEQTGQMVVPVEVNSINVPVQTDASETDKKELTVEIPATKTSADGQTVFTIGKITAEALKTPEGSNTVVTKVILPETKEKLDVAEGAMKPNGTPIEVVTPIQLLAAYSLDNSFKENYEARKISAVVSAPNKYWTFSSGVDCLLPEGVTAYIAEWDAASNTPRIVALEGDQLKLKDGKNGIKANNGVLMASEKGGSYVIVANPGSQASGSAVATTDANNYQGNCLTPVIVSKNYPADEILILKDNKFHTIKSNLSEVRPCKAVFSLVKAGAK